MMKRGLQPKPRSCMHVDRRAAHNTPAIPLDIILCIIEYFHPPKVYSSGYPDYGREEKVRLDSLCSLAGLSTKWLEPCCRMIYRDVWASKDNPKRNQLFMRTLQERPAIGLFVKRLFIRDWAVVDSVHLMPNISTLGLDKRRKEMESKSLLKLKHINRHVIFHESNWTLSEPEWEEASTSWPLLESITFKHTHPHFSDSFQSRQLSFPSLHTIAWVDA